jgi:hypothetical protein
LKNDDAGGRGWFCGLAGDPLEAVGNANGLLLANFVGESITEAIRGQSQEVKDCAI